MSAESAGLFFRRAAVRSVREDDEAGHRPTESNGILSLRTALWASATLNGWDDGGPNSDRFEQVHDFFNELLESWLFDAPN